MARADDDPAALKALHDAIYRDTVRLARSMTGTQRLEAAFEITDFVLENMLAGAMWQNNLTDREEEWKEVRLRLDRLRRVHEAGRYTTKRPS